MPTLSTDHIFHIGTQHLRNGLPCQDYALSKTLNNAAYAIVSDGCSSGGKTDVGARLMCLTTANAIAWRSSTCHPHRLPEAINRFQTTNLKMAELSLDLQLTDLLATQFYAFVSPQGGIIHLRGDGVLAVLYTDGLLSLRRFEWANNTPLYPAYEVDKFANFASAHGQYPFSYTDATGPINGPLTEKQSSQTYSLHQALQGYTEIIAAVELPQISMIAVFTDGVTQVEGLPWYEAARQLMAFKGTAGEFAKRRMNRFLKDISQLSEKEMEQVYASIPVPKGTSKDELTQYARHVAQTIESRKAKKGPLDDIAYAVIHIQHEQQE